VLKCNQEVAYAAIKHGPYPEADPAERPPVARVWRAITDYKEFGKWFRVNLETPFVAGKPTLGRLTFPGYENIQMEIVVQKIEPQRLFSYTWHPYAVDPKVDYASETPTLVEFVLQAAGPGTLLVITESGFDSIPAYRRDEAFRMNSGGWSEQLASIQNYVASNP